MTISSSAPAVVLLSGGLDSATCLAIARAEGRPCFALTFDYGQRHRHELAAAAAVARQLSARECRVIRIDLRAIGGSALTADIDVPKDRAADDAQIPITYVPARNLTFLALAVGYAETLGTRDIFIGVNAVDYSGYPDCRPEFIRSFELAANLATKAGVEAAPGQGFRIHTPLIALSKADIIRRGTELGVDYAMTSSCYDPDSGGLACGRCDSCRLRREGFASAAVPDPTRYVLQSFSRV